jgi:hypothetical protein
MGVAIHSFCTVADESIGRVMCYSAPVKGCFNRGRLTADQQQTVNGGPNGVPPLWICVPAAADLRSVEISISRCRGSEIRGDQYPPLPRI